MYKRLFAAALLLATATTNATAQDWSGAYIGIGAASIQSESTGFVTALPTLGWAGEDTGTVGALFAGYDWQVGGREVLGVEFEYVAGAFGATGPLNGNPNETFTEEFANVASLSLRFGYAFENFLPYVSAGVTNADYELRIAGNGIPGARNLNLTGTTVGLGLDYLMAERHQLRVEWSYTQFDDEEFVGLGSAVPLTQTGINFSQFSVGYAYRF